MSIKTLATLIALFFGMGLLVFYIQKIISYYRFGFKYLKALGLYHEDKKKFVDANAKTIREKVVSSSIKVTKEKNSFVFKKYNPAFAVHDFERLKPNLEHVLKIKIEHISSRKPMLPWRQPEIILHTESFKNLLSMSDCPKDLEAGQYWIGRTALGENLTLDLKKGDFSLGIFSLAGGGKGNSIMAVTSSFLDTWVRTTGSHFYRVLILDAKGTDFHELIRKYAGTKTVNPIFLDELKNAVSILENYKNEIDEYRRYLAENGITISHWLKIKKKYPDVKPIPQPLLLICDELSQYMTPRPSIRINKDSSDEQIQLKEQYDLEDRLALLINSILQLFRSSGVFVILSNQTLKVEELTLQRTNIINFLLGRNSAQMSRMLVGDEKTLTDSTLKSGKFIFSGNGHVIKVQVPYILKDD